MKKTKRVATIILASFLFFCLSFNTAYLEDINLIASDEINQTDETNEKEKFSMKVIEEGDFNTYFNYAKGYSIRFPKSYEVDDSISHVKDVFYDENTKIEVYHDDFNNTINNASTYIYYGNKNIMYNDNFIKKELNRYIDINGYSTHLLKWDRPKLRVLENDKNYYVSAEIIENKYSIYTIFIKSTNPINNYMEILNSFNIIEKSEAYPQIEKFSSQRSRNFNEETQEFYNTYLKNKYKKLKWGIFEHTAPHNMSVLNKIEDDLEHEFEFLLKYQNLDSKLSVEELRNASKEDKYLELTLQTCLYYGDNTNINYRILNGEFDEFFNRYAKYVKEFGEPVLFRLNNEMNGDWCTYSSYYMAKDTDLYKAIWKHVYNIFETNEVDNAIWVWNPNNLDLPGFKWNHYLNYYPGDEYVDVVGLTAYNTGTYFPGEHWSDFDTLYTGLYNEYDNIFDFPFIITEFAANSVGGDKASWIEDMLSKINKYNKIRIAIWFNGIDRDHKGNPARIYRLDENEEIIRSFREGLKNYKEEQATDLDYLNAN